VVVSGAAQPAVGVSNLYSFSAVSNASAYEWRLLQLQPLTFFDGAETGLTNFIVQCDTNLYAVQDASVKKSGAYSLHLAHTNPVSQILLVNRVVVPGTNGQLQFQSRLGYAGDGQFARVQVSLDDGASWNDVYSQVGSGGSGESSFICAPSPWRPMRAGRCGCASPMNTKSAGTTTPNGERGRLVSR